MVCDYIKPQFLVPACNVKLEGLPIQYNCVLLKRRKLDTDKQTKIIIMWKWKQITGQAASQLMILDTYCVLEFEKPVPLAFRWAVTRELQ